MLRHVAFFSSAMHQLFLQTVCAICVQIFLLQHTLPLGHRHGFVHLLLRQGLGFCKYTIESALKRKLHCKKVSDFYVPSRDVTL
jgi:hypothetical protein